MGTQTSDPVNGDAKRETHAHVHQRQRSVVNRLARVEGHVRAVKHMVEEGTPCPDVLMQIAALRSALDSVGRIILEDHIRECMVDAVQTGDFDQSWHDLQQSLERFIG